MDTSQEDWWKLARAFYALAHQNPADFERLEERLKETDVGRFCREYIRTGDFQSLNRAGRLLTGTDHWYVFLGRCF